MSSTDTRARILEAAERLFALHGLAATSLRTITEAARVNLASVHYHFGSKEALVKEIFSRRLKPINQERLRRLEKCEGDAGAPISTLEGIVKAFVAPPLYLRNQPCQGGEFFMRLMSRLYTEPNATKMIFLDEFSEVRRRFSTALGRALPHLDEVELGWRIHFMIGSMAHTAGASQILKSLSDGRCDPDDVEGTVDRLTAFLVAGLSAPSSATLECT